MVAQARALALDRLERQLLAAARDQLEGPPAQADAREDAAASKNADTAAAPIERRKAAWPSSGESSAADEPEDDRHRELRAQRPLLRLGARERVIGTKTVEEPMPSAWQANGQTASIPLCQAQDGVKKPARRRLARLGLADAVADAGDGLDQLRLARIALDLAAQRGDVDAQQVALAVALAPRPPG